MKLLYLAPYCCACLGNVICCGLGRQLPRQVFKVALMPLLAYAYTLAAQPPETLVLLALAMGWIGDLWLIRPNKTLPRTLGVVFFSLGHFCYLSAMLRRFPAPPDAITLCATAVFFLVVAVFLYCRLLPVMTADMRIPGGAYFLLLAALCVMSALLALSGVRGGWLLVPGAVLFLSSDTILCYQFFTVGDPAPKYDAVVMLTYVLAQAFLLCGLCL